MKGIGRLNLRFRAEVSGGAGSWHWTIPAGTGNRPARDAIHRTFFIVATRERPGCPGASSARLVLRLGLGHGETRRPGPAITMACNGRPGARRALATGETRAYASRQADEEFPRGVCLITGKGFSPRAKPFAICASQAVNSVISHIESGPNYIGLSCVISQLLIYYVNCKHTTTCQFGVGNTVGPLQRYESHPCS